MGIFELSVLCQDLFPAAGTWDDDCAYQYLKCDESVAGTNVGMADWVGSEAGDAVYLISIFEPVKLAITTCSGTTSFDAELHLMDGPPNNGESVIVAQSDVSWTRRTECATLFYEAVDEAALYLMVGGASEDEEGLFQVQARLKRPARAPDLDH